VLWHIAVLVRRGRYLVPAKFNDGHSVVFLFSVVLGQELITPMDQCPLERPTRWFAVGASSVNLDTERPRGAVSESQFKPNIPASGDR
jgi:hypothetical protein